MTFPSRSTPTASPSPAAAYPPDDTQATRPLTWRYPFTADCSNEITDPQIFFDAFARMDDGYFPVGVNGFPHGGVHFGAGTAAAVDQADGVRCLADGEIVAYKLDATYPHLPFTQDGRWAMYATGFVLVRHTLTLPPLPDSKAPPSAEDTQTLYSLYLHLADVATYLMNDTLKRPGWWPGVPTLQIGSADRYGGGEGARVRGQPIEGAKGRYRAGDVVGYLPARSEVVIGERRGPWGRIQSITVGTLQHANGDEQDIPELPRKGAWLYLPEQHAASEPTDLGHVVVPSEPISVNAGTLLGHLGEYIDYERSTPLPPQPMRPLLHLEVFADGGFETFLQKSRQRAQALPDDQKTLVVVQPGAQLVPTFPPPDTCMGEGHYTEYTLARVEVTPDSPIAGRWVKVQGIHADPHLTPKTVGVQAYHKAEPRWIERTQLSQANANTRAWLQFPLSLRHVAEPANGHRRVFPLSELRGLPSDAQAQDDQGYTWYHVDYGTAEGKTVQGWLRDTHHPGTERVSPWAWAGFEIVDATGIDLADALKRNIVASGGADWKEEHDWASAVQAVDGSALFQTLQQTVGAQHYRENGHRYTNPNTGKVTPKALQTALRHPWLAQALSHLILKYESEWGGNLARWEALTLWMKEAKENWHCELQRIKALQWWDEVKGKVDGFPDSPVVYHIHPIALVGNFFRISLSLEELIKEIGDIISGGEGGYESYNTGTKDVPGGRVGHSYQTPPVGTVTDRTINEIIATEPLLGTNTKRLFATGKYQTTISTLRLAKVELNLSGDEKYDPKMQERIFRDFLFNKAGKGALSRFVRDGEGSVDDAQYAAAKEWASIAVPSGMSIMNHAISDGTMSYYSSPANSASMTSTNKLRALLIRISMRT